MAEPTSSAAGAGIAIKLGVIAGIGVLGGMLMAAFDPPKDKKQLAAQASVAGVGSLFFGPLAVRWLAGYDWYARALVDEGLQAAMPVYLLTGALAWGFFGAVAVFRRILRERGGQAAADRVLGPRNDA